MLMWSIHPLNIHSWSLIHEKATHPYFPIIFPSVSHHFPIIFPSIHCGSLPHRQDLTKRYAELAEKNADALRRAEAAEEEVRPERPKSAGIMRYPNMDCLFHGKSQTKIWMMLWGYPYFRKPPNMVKHGILLLEYVKGQPKNGIIIIHWYWGKNGKWLEMNTSTSPPLLLHLHPG